jgi:Spy/CpxP family protein refolding chaperone
MKTLVLFCAMALATSAFAWQGAAPAGKEGHETGNGRGGHQMMSVDDQLKDMTQKLNLTSDQQAKIKPILEDTHQQMQSFMKDESLSREDKVSKLRSLHQSALAKVRDVLTDEQKKKLDQEMRDHMQSQQEKKDNPGAPK